MTKEQARTLIDTTQYILVVLCILTITIGFHL
jgi:hypothetical protein